MEQSKVSYRSALSLGGAYMAFIIGSGFATGNEILTFFASYGTAGFVGVAISLIIFTTMGITMMADGKDKNLDTQSKAFSYYFGTYLGIPLSWFNSIFMYSVFAIMLSGAGAIVEQHYGINQNIGTGIVALLAVLTVVAGLQTMVGAIGFIGPIIIIFTMFVGIAGGFANIEAFGQADQILETVTPPQASSNAYLSGLLYACYPLVTLVPFLTSVGWSAPNSKTARLGGAIGGITLMAGVAIVTFGLLANIGAAWDKEVPSLVLADQISPMVGHALTIVMLAGIFTTAVPMLFMSVSRFGKEKTTTFNISAIVLALAAVIGLNFVSFGKLIQTVYPATGYIGIAILVVVIVRAFIIKPAVPTN